MGAVAGVDPHQLVLHHQQGNDVAAYIQSDPIYAVQIIEFRLTTIITLYT